MSYHPAMRLASRTAWLTATLAILAAAGACASDVDDLFGGAGGASTSPSTTGPGAPSTDATDASASTGGPVTGSTVVGSTGAGPGCGNGTLDPDEACDGADLGGHTCVDKAFASPEGAVCTPQCLVDYAGCAAKCGNGGLPEPGEECDDGGNVSGDGCSDACLVEGLSCAVPIALDVSSGMITVAGTTAGGTDAFQAIGCTQGGGATGPELVYALHATEAGFLTVWTVREATTFDSVLYLRDACDQADSEIVCNDNLEGFHDLVGTYVEQGQTVHLFVDGFMAASGAFQIAIDLSDGTCDDPVPIIAGGAGVRVVGTTDGQGSDHGSTCGGTNGEDVVYSVTRFLQGDLTVRTDATFNSVTYARSTCTSSATQIECDQPNNSLDSEIFVNEAGAAPFFVFVDTESGAPGRYTVEFDP